MPQALKATGTTFWIGTTASDGATDTYTQIANVKQVNTMGGGAYTMADSTTLDDTIRQTTKTLFDAADIDIEGHEMIGDAGQAALRASFLDSGDVPYNFEARFPQGDRRRLKAKVVQHSFGIGGATSLRMVRAKLEPTTDAIYVPAP